MTITRETSDVADDRPAGSTATGDGISAHNVTVTYRNGHTALHDATFQIPRGTITALVGVNGEIEHGALWHVPGGYAMREMLGQALSIVPSSKKLGAMGATLDVPIHHKDAAYVRSHFDAITVMVADAPRPDELMFVLAMTTGARPHARMSGLKADEISKWDGLR